MLLSHHLYELRKGVRRLVLHTTGLETLDEEIQKLDRMGFAYLPLAGVGSRVNLLIGASECLDVIASFEEQNLSRFTPEQDFILGTMLGYGLEQQCIRYLKKQLTRSAAICLELNEQGALS